MNKISSNMISTLNKFLLSISAIYTDYLEHIKKSNILWNLQLLMKKSQNLKKKSKKLKKKVALLNKTNMNWKIQSKNKISTHWTHNFLLQAKVNIKRKDHTPSINHMISTSKNNLLLWIYNSPEKEGQFSIANLLPSLVRKNRAEKILIMNLKRNMINLRLMGVQCLKFWTEILQLKEKMLKTTNKKKQMPINMQGCAVELNPWA